MERTGASSHGRSAASRDIHGMSRLAEPPNAPDLDDLLYDFAATAAMSLAEVLYAYMSGPDCWVAFAPNGSKRLGDVLQCAVDEVCKYEPDDQGVDLLRRSRKPGFRMKPIM